jgi:ubiquinone biosynthesis monooxygenase Coq7
MQRYDWLDRVIVTADSILKTVFAETVSNRPNPASDCPEASLSVHECKHVAGLMRVNHSGEVCAQALYQGQALTSRDPSVKAKMADAAKEEVDHLAWCHERLHELNSHTSYLNPLWYGGSLIIGILAGLIGDRWNLGFVAETENQVVKHLEAHLKSLPAQDIKSQTILETMRADEAKHRDMAIAAGAAELPRPVQLLMHLTSQVMVKTAYWL